MHSLELYGLACKDFLRNQRNVMESISSAVSAGDLQVARFHAHTLKGIAALIEEETLADFAGAAEKLFRKDEVKTEVIDSLANEMNRVLAKISKDFPEYDESKGSLLPLDKDAAREVFDKAVLLLEQHSFDIIYTIEELSKIPRTEKIVEYIENADFAPALEAITRLRKELEV